jgi:hypothetical protein
VSSPAAQLGGFAAPISQLTPATFFVKPVSSFQRKKMASIIIVIGIMDEKVIATVSRHVIRRRIRLD